MYCPSPNCAAQPCASINHHKYVDVGESCLQVTTASKDCQVWFDRGLAMMFGFNHEEAVRCFQRGVVADPNCAMLYWGISWALGPNYNNGAGLDGPGALEAAKQAETRLDNASPLEKQLVKALFSRFKDEPAPDHVAFANTMRKVYEAFPDNANVCSFFAEALMNLAPWALWTPKPECKAAIPETLELVAVLEQGLRINPKHLGLGHLYIHAMELSATPEKALGAANALRKGHSLGHLLHMPSHIDMWLGAYETAIKSNLHAVEADNELVALNGKSEEFYKFYRLHNLHFVSWAACFDGQFAVAMDYARRAQQELGPQQVQFMLGDDPFGAMMLESYAATVWHVLVRFGQWNAILSEPVPEDPALYPGTRATAFYARGVAFAALGRVPEAEAEQLKFKEAVSNPALVDRKMSNNFMWRGGRNRQEGVLVGLLNVAEEVLAGEIEYRKKNYEKAFDHLRAAVKLDQALIYDEPWGWMMPTRHPLGALLLEQGELKEAESVFREDLVQYRDNLWALRGLQECLNKQGRTDEAQEVAIVLARVSQRTDGKIRAACFCATTAV